MDSDIDSRPTRGLLSLDAWMKAPLAIYHTKRRGRGRGEASGWDGRSDGY